MPCANSWRAKQRMPSSAVVSRQPSREAERWYAGRRKEALILGKRGKCAISAAKCGKGSEQTTAIASDCRHLAGPRNSQAVAIPGDICSARNLFRCRQTAVAREMLVRDSNPRFVIRRPQNGCHVNCRALDWPGCVQDACRQLLLRQHCCKKRVPSQEPAISRTK